MRVCSSWDGMAVSRRSRESSERWRPNFVRKRGGGSTTASESSETRSMLAGPCLQRAISSRGSFPNDLMSRCRGVVSRAEACIRSPVPSSGSRRCFERLDSRSWKGRNSKTSTTTSRRSISLRTIRRVPCRTPSTSPTAVCSEPTRHRCRYGSCSLAGLP